MARTVLSLSVLVFVLAACSLGQPRLAAETDYLDLGEVVNGEIVIRDVQIRNEGTAELIIEAVSTSCGCTKAWVEPDSIQPGQSAILRIEFDSGAHGPELNGRLTRQIFVASNDPGVPERVITFESFVIPQEAP